MPAISHRQSSVRKKLTPEAYRVGWISALPLEFTAAQAILDDIHEPLPTDPNDENEYILGSSGSHNIVMACLPLGNYGTNSAAIVATNMNRSFSRLHIRLLVGVGGGVPGQIDIRLGDVVVSSDILQYDLGKTVEDGHFQRTGDFIKPPPHLLTATSKTSGKPEQTSNNTSSLVSQMIGNSADMAMYAYPRHKDRLFDTDTRPKIHYGRIASANQVMKHGRTRDELARQHSILCFEMEAAGIMHSFPSLVIRGICDYSDSHKNKAWQNYAAATAAAYAKELLSLIPTPQDEISDPANTFVEPVSLQSGVSSFMDSLEFEEIDSRQETIDEAHESTCKWLLDHQGYKDWLSLENANEDRGLWINGKPGAGKSTLIKYAFANAKSDADPDTTVTSFFFNARGVDLEKSTTGMYRSILFQLLKGRPELQGLLMKQGSWGKRSQSPWSLKELRELFETAVTNLGHHRLICFIDALDESEEDDVRKMISDFLHWGKLAADKDSIFSVCFSSRHYPFADISFGLKLSLDDQQGHIKDIEKYVQSELDTGSGENAEEIKREILRKAEGIFMWVVLVVKILNKEYRRGRIFAVQKRLQELPSKLSDLFKGMMTRDDEYMDDLLLCIQWLLFAKRPLTVQEFYFALAAGLAPAPENLGEWDRELISEDSMQRYVTSSSKGLALVTRSKPETVQFIHESVRDFLIAHGGVKEVWPEHALNFEPFSHNQLKECCYNYLTVNTLEDTFGKRMQISGQKPGRRFPFLQYANHYILHHANAAAYTIPQDCFLKKFSQENFENWGMIRNLFGRNQDNPPPLLYVLAEYNLTVLVRTHLRLDPKFNCKGGRFGYPIFVALANGHPGVVKELFHGINSLGNDEESNQSAHEQEFEYQEGQTPLIWAIEEGNVSRAKLLIESKEFDVNSWQEKHGQTAVSTAAQYGRDDIMKLLLAEEGANPGLKDGFQRTPLSRAAETNHLAVAEILLATGRAKENSKDRKGRTALLWAVKNGHVDTVRLLLKTVGVDANARDRRGETPLLWAVRRGYVEIVKLLVRVKGLDIDARDKKYFTALSVAARNGHSRIVEILEAAASLNPDPEGKVGTTPLS
ncbi:hypothetical protein BGZ61DRAFT_550384 [Ilyonectria robusta]|uniref:uncharacterized protein n=1 Tax=Ilyonectria robusta TaxID=1079257 RepID=UPI001E8E6C91|nr:uncharacterized protein BGZ61DRAFT_550384 [Ilyonectria robusta]KAH8683581.1 hypothetical protein BGZ61DRAFT_550384 [Ilyonectria robusta]